jgi:hypothetical protein
MPKSTDAKPLQLVVPIAEMSDERIVRHFNARHAEAYAGGSPLIPDPHPDAKARGESFKLGNRSAWDVTHAFLHERSDCGHVHGTA